MDFLECGICHIPYDEDNQRPRTSLCGHEFCTTCLKALINDGEYVCPKCREKIKINVVEDLPVNFGLMDVIRAFKANTISLTKYSDIGETGACASNEDVCGIHCKSITHWCYKCELWICIVCIESHNSLIGCATTSSTKAMEGLKDNHNKTVDQLLFKFEDNTNHVTSKIQEHTNKRKELLEIAEKHGEEVKRLQHVLHLGNDHKDKLVESKKHLNEIKTPLAVSESIKIVTQRKQTLLSWVAKNIGADVSLETKQDLLKALEEKHDVYVEKDVKHGEKYSKLSHHDGNIYVHTYRAHDMTEKSSCMPYDCLQKLITSSASLVFMEFSIGGVAKEYVLIRLSMDLPMIRKDFIQFVTGDHGLSFIGTSLGVSTPKQLFKVDLPFSEIKITPDSNRTALANEGDLMVFLGNGYLQHLNFYLNASAKSRNYGKNWHAIGKVEKGMEILHECYDNHSLGVKISDCGLVIEQE